MPSLGSIRFATAAGFLATAIGAAADDTSFEFSAIIEGHVALGTDSVRLQQSEFVFSPEVSGYLSDNVFFKSVGRMRFDFSDKLEPGAPPNGFRSRANRRGFIGSVGDVELREFYADFDLGDHFLRLGKQQIVWGEADGLQVLDVLNPQSFREFILPDFDESRIPLWSANLELALSDDSTLQLVWLPDQTYDDIPTANAAFAFTAPEFVPVIPSGVPVNIAPVKRPRRILQDSDVGVRYTTFISGWELSANYSYHYFDRPNFRRTISSSGITITPEYDRTHLVGGTFNTALGDWVARGEIGYSTERFFLTRSPSDIDGVAASGEFAYVLGLDYQGITDTFLSAQVFQSILTDRAAGVVRNTVQNTITLLAERKFKNETISAEMLAIHSLDDDDGVLQAKLSYSVRSNIEVKLGYDFFYGRTAGIFGQFDQNDRINLQVEFGY